MSANSTTSAALDPRDILDRLAKSCSRSEDDVFWVLTSAGAHLNGYDLRDGEPSSMAIMLRKRNL